MPLPDTVPNPFALMMDPEAVFQAIERSGRLARLHSRICRPLDNPARAHQGEEAEGDSRDVIDDQPLRD